MKNQKSGKNENKKHRLDAMSMTEKPTNQTPQIPAISCEHLFFVKI